MVRMFKIHLGYPGRGELEAFKTLGLSWYDGTPTQGDLGELSLEQGRRDAGDLDSHKCTPSTALPACPVK